MNENIDFTLNIEKRRCILGDEPHIFHCNHYNNYLQRTIVEDPFYIDSAPFINWCWSRGVLCSTGYFIYWFFIY